MKKNVGMLPLHARLKLPFLVSSSEMVLKGWHGDGVGVVLQNLPFLRISWKTSKKSIAFLVPQIGLILFFTRHGDFLVGASEHKNDDQKSIQTFMKMKPPGLYSSLLRLAWTSTSETPRLESQKVKILCWAGLKHKKTGLSRQNPEEHADWRLVE